MKLSVVIPVLNEAVTIDDTLRAVMARVAPLEVIVVDGGSTDGTVAVAERPGVRVINGPRGRGSQMHVGASAATGDALWFLHADTLPPPDGATQIEQALRDPQAIGGNFDIHFDGDFASAKFLTWVYRHLSWIGLRYGDSGYFVRRDAYDAVGGFRPYPIFEDLDLLRRLRRRGRFVRVPATVITSSRRFAGRSFALVFARWTFMQVLYWLGASPIWLGRFYEHIRVPGRAWRSWTTDKAKGTHHADLSANPR
ncbi:MAG TPA: TIGR04283 family arsenosugar biosynthesis glycosyltransferase [Tepidisphaeraceae bacterium]|jgi:rSAM/selenodomain-associated transferase 2|nr:TIGR04283 family arsenosugar biosynthesis glycosyltransferase [Tepidisphaeraceae bacterium]